MTEHSLIARAALERDRDEIRGLGYAVSRQDVTLHACAVGRAGAATTPARWSPR